MYTHRSLKYLWQMTVVRPECCHKLFLEFSLYFPGFRCFSCLHCWLSNLSSALREFARALKEHLPAYEKEKLVQ